MGVPVEKGTLVGRQVTAKKGSIQVLRANSPERAISLVFIVPTATDPSGSPEFSLSAQGGSALFTLMIHD